MFDPTMTPPPAGAAPMTPPPAAAPMTPPPAAAPMTPPPAAAPMTPPPATAPMTPPPAAAPMTPPSALSAVDVNAIPPLPSFRLVQTASGFAWIVGEDASRAWNGSAWVLL